MSVGRAVPHRAVPRPAPLRRTLDRWRDLRNRWLASPRFRRWAASVPFTRPVARRHARELFDLCAGFVYSQVLLACVRLRLLECLASGPRSPSDLADELALPAEAANRLLRAAAALDLVEKSGDGRFALGPLGAVVVGEPGIAAMVEHHALLYADLADPVAFLRGTAGARGLGGFWGYGDSDAPAALRPEDVAAYSTLMAASQPLVAGEVLDAYPLRRHRCLLDVGGGDGAFLAAVAHRAPHLRLMLFDLPAVAERARAAAAAAGRTLHAVGGDFFRDPLPAGADVVSLVRVLHDHDDASVARLLASVRAALPRGGTVLVAEPMGGAGDAGAVGDAYFGWYLMAMGRGRVRTADELRVLLAGAGFSGIRAVATRLPLQTGLVTAHVP